MQKEENADIFIKSWQLLWNIGEELSIWEIGRERKEVERNCLTSCTVGVEVEEEEVCLLSRSVQLLSLFVVIKVIVLLLVSFGMDLVEGKGGRVARITI